jgi:hypothetical protein
MDLHGLEQGCLYLLPYLYLIFHAEDDVRELKREEMRGKGKW